MNGKFTIECPHCGHLFTESLVGLTPGTWRHCPNCSEAIRFSARDIEHLRDAAGHAGRDKV